MGKSENILVGANIFCGTLLFLTAALIALNVGFLLYAAGSTLIILICLFVIFILNINYITKNYATQKFRSYRYLMTMAVLVIALTVIGAMVGRLGQRVIFQKRLPHYVSLLRAYTEGADEKALQQKLDALPFWVGSGILVNEEEGILTLQVMITGSALGHIGYIYSSNGEAPVHLRKYSSGLTFNRINEHWFHFGD